MSCTTERDLLFGEISRERDRQDRIWGGVEHDDSHSRQDWLSFIHKQGRLAEQAWSPSAVAEKEFFESRMVKIAALAIAAIESSRRKR